MIRKLVIWHVVLTAVFIGLTAAMQPGVTAALLAQVQDLGAYVDIAMQFHLCSIVIAITNVCFLAGILLHKKRHPDSDINLVHICTLSLLLNVIAVTRSLQLPLCIDDSYIDFRYVHNWLAGQPDYNPGEKVLGFTSHLHVMVMYLLCKLFSLHNVPELAVVLNVLLSLISAVLLFVLVKRIFSSNWIALASVATYTVNIYALQQVGYGKESHMIVALILMCLLGLQSSKPSMVAWSSCLIFLTRPEGCFWAAIAMAHSLWRLRMKAVKAWIPPIALVLLVYAIIFFSIGTIIPHGFVAKSSTPNSGAYFAFAWISLGMMVTNMNLNGWFEAVHHEQLFVTGLVLGLVALGLTFALLMKQPVLRFYAVACIAQMLFLQFAAQLKNITSHWYLCWFALLLPLLFAAALDWAMKQSKLRRNITLTGLAAFAILLTVRFFDLGILYFGTDQNRTLDLLRFAKTINQMARPTDVVASHDIGVLGYCYKGEILDIAGLLSERALKYHIATLKNTKATTFVTSPELIQAERPTFVVARTDLFELTRTKDWFKRDYETIAEAAPGKLASYFVLYRLRDSLTTECRRTLKRIR